MKTKRILMQTTCAVIATVLLCGCNHSQSIDNETSNTDTTQDTSTVLVPEISTATGTTAATTETPTLPEVVIPESWGEWFLTGEDSFMTKSEPEITEQYRNWTLKTPMQMTVERGNIVYTVELFKDVYRFGEGLQVRVTARNVGNEDVSYMQAFNWCHIYSPNQKDFLEYKPINRKQLEEFETGDFYGKTLVPGESVVHDRLYIIDPTFFSVAGTYTLHFEVIRNGDAKYHPETAIDYSFDIPLEVIAG